MAGVSLERATRWKGMFSQLRSESGNPGEAQRPGTIAVLSPSSKLDPLSPSSASRLGVQEVIPEGNEDDASSSSLPGVKEEVGLCCCD